MLYLLLRLSFNVLLSSLSSLWIWSKLQVLNYIFVYYSLGQEGVQRGEPSHQLQSSRPSTDPPQTVTVTTVTVTATPPRRL